MADYIDRQAVIDIVRGYGERLNDHIGTLDDSEVYAYARGLILSIESNICGVPSADVQPVQHGVWMEENRRPRSAMFYCSECHRTAYDIQPTRDKTWAKRCRYAYCPNCGARMLKYTGMDGEQNDIR